MSRIDTYNMKNDAQRLVPQEHTKIKQLTNVINVLKIAIYAKMENIVNNAVLLILFMIVDASKHAQMDTLHLTEYAINAKLKIAMIAVMTKQIVKNVNQITSNITRNVFKNVQKKHLQIPQIFVV